MTEFEKYKKFIADNIFATSQDSLPRELLIKTDDIISIYYAPFDYINRRSRVVICGLTPGIRQALLALSEAHKQLKLGKNMNEVLKRAKEEASFGGSMRHNLIKILDFIGLNHKLGLSSCARLFSTDTHLVHYTSALRYPVFKNGGNYSGSPNILKHPLLVEQFNSYFLEEVKAIPIDCIWIPLGPKVSTVFGYMEKKGILTSERVFHGLPHPSGANAERIAYFLREKESINLSSKTNAKVIDAARSAILKKITALHWE